MPQTATVNTPIGLHEAATILQAALRLQLAPAIVTRNLCLYLLAQIWFETARGRSVQCRNPGNLTSNGEPDTFWRPPWFAEPTDATSPRYRDLHAKMLVGKAPRAFLAFESFEEGFAAYVTWLRTKFSSILNAAQSDNASAVAHAIRVSGYCPDCVEATTSEALATLVAEFRGFGLFPSAPSIKQVALPNLRLGDSGPAVQLARAASNFDRSVMGPPDFTPAFRDYLRTHAGVVFSVDDVIGTKTWDWIIVKLGEGNV